MRINPFSRAPQKDFGSLQFRGLMTEAELAEAVVSVAKNEAAANSGDAAFAMARLREALDMIDRYLASPGTMSADQVDLLNERRSLLRALEGSFSR